VTLLATLANGVGSVVLRHIIRWGLGAVALGAIAFAFARHRANAGTSPHDVRSRWRQLQLEIWARALIGGAILGATWSWNSRQSLWLHALRVLVVVAIIGPVLRLILQRARHAPSRRPHRPWVTVLAVRLGIVVVGVCEQWVLQKVMTPGSAAITTGATIAVLVGVGSPLFITRRIEHAYRARHTSTAGAAPTSAV
jgi:hypothetical protein